MQIDILAISWISFLVTCLGRMNIAENGSETFETIEIMVHGITCTRRTSVIQLLTDHSSHFLLNGISIDEAACCH